MSFVLEYECLDHHAMGDVSMQSGHWTVHWWTRRKVVLSSSGTRGRRQRAPENTSYGQSCGVARPVSSLVYFCCARCGSQVAVSRQKWPADLEDVSGIPLMLLGSESSLWTV